MFALRNTKLCYQIKIKIKKTFTRGVGFCFWKPDVIDGKTILTYSSKGRGKQIFLVIPSSKIIKKYPHKSATIQKLLLGLYSRLRDYCLASIMGHTWSMVVRL